ncbi:MAG TPA: hypothetical protein VFW55_09490 [Propionicimonas sp.]|nr:hypothetical protein [Propionicimonas sp.]
MAEIRKHNPATGTAIQQALRAAMGEGIRPRVPGEVTPAKPASTPATGATTWVSLTVKPATPEPEPEDDETAGP